MPKEIIKPTIIVDTRERRPWTFDATTFDVKREGLSTGDYSLVGLESRIAVERKSLGDLVSTVTHDWLRFRKELYRLAAFDFAAIIVEADTSDLWQHRYEAQVDPASVWGRANDCLITHGVPVLFWGQRPVCEPAVGRLMKILHCKFSE